MKNKTLLYGFLVVVIAIGGIGGYMSLGTRKNQSVQQVTTSSKDDCLAKGGVWQKWGLAQLEYCQIPSQDAGKSCTDSSQCTYYKCISTSGKVPGKCATYKNTFGCFSIIENGKVQQALCAD